MAKTAGNTFHSLSTADNNHRRLSMPQREALPSKDFGLPGKGSGQSGKGSGSYPMPDKKHAALAKSMAARFASVAQRATIDAKANAILGK